MKKLFLLQLILSTFLAPTLVFSQNSDAVISELQKIHDAFLYSERNIELSYLKKVNTANDFTSVAKGTLMYYEGKEKVVFEGYETLKSNQFYAKADHVKKELYLLKGETESKESIYPLFTKEVLDAYKVKYDSSASDKENGQLIFKGYGGSPYQFLKLEYHPEKHELKAYTITYNPSYSPEMTALKIQFKSVEVKEEDKGELFSFEKYYQEKEDSIIVADKYSTYKLITNF